MKKISYALISLAALCLFVFAFIFQCSPMEDGMYMNCHKSNVAIAVISCVILILSVLSFILKNTIAKKIIFVITAILSVICMITPGVLIHLCMMPEMTCRATFRPAAIICSIIILLFSVFALLFDKKEKA